LEFLVGLAEASQPNPKVRSGTTILVGDLISERPESEFPGFTRLPMARLTASRRRLRFELIRLGKTEKHSRLRLAVKRKMRHFQL